MKEQVKQAVPPHLSILLVIRNEEPYIAGLLDKLLNQKRQGFTMELIVVDGQSTDKTASIVKMYSEKNTQVQLLENPGKTLPIGWNIGIKHAVGDYVLRIDGHTTIPDDFLEQYATVIKKNPEADVVGGIIHSRGEGKQGKVNEYVYSHPFGVGNSKFRTLKENIGRGMLTPFRTGHTSEKCLMKWAYLKND
ncbi:glycosyltransferase [Bacillus sp. JCM 19041]|uniref:glycosyltransferase n=1 Tax=Bacillus sp. JCM 19041 TaxID=1460637 RepID=UPI000AE2FCB7